MPLNTSKYRPQIKSPWIVNCIKFPEICSGDCDPFRLICLQFFFFNHHKFNSSSCYYIKTPLKINKVLTENDTKKLQLNMGISKFLAPGHLGHYTFSYRINTTRVKNRLSFKKVENVKSWFCDNNFNLQNNCSY